MKHLQSAKRTLQTEWEGLQQVAVQLSQSFDEVVEALLACQGKVVVTGMGKSGLIGQKIAATMASTGTPAFFLHPGEALHGDLGMLSPGDAVVLLSYSGETEELLRMLAHLHEAGHATISITGFPDSTLARKTDLHLNAHVPKEACPLALAPTASTTATMALGDALAVALMEARGFQPEDFARFHPGGSLGYKLLTTVGEVMRTENLPFVSIDVSPADLLIRMSEGKLGIAIVGSAENVEGVVTDGDLRRAMVKFGRLDRLSIPDMMTKHPITVAEAEKVGKVEHLMRERKITVVLVTADHRVVGVHQLF